MAKKKPAAPKGQVIEGRQPVRRDQLSPAGQKRYDEAMGRMPKDKKAK